MDDIKTNGIEADSMKSGLERVFEITGRTIERGVEEDTFLAMHTRFGRTMWTPKSKMDAGRMRAHAFPDRASALAALGEILSEKSFEGDRAAIIEGTMRVVASWRDRTPYCITAMRDGKPVRVSRAWNCSAMDPVKRFVHDTPAPETVFEGFANASAKLIEILSEPDSDVESLDVSTLKVVPLEEALAKEGGHLESLGAQDRKAA